MVNGQWAMGNGQCAMGNGQWAVGNGQWASSKREEANGKGHRQKTISCHLANTSGSLVHAGRGSRIAPHGPRTYAAAKGSQTHSNSVQEGHFILFVFEQQQIKLCQHNQITKHVIEYALCSLYVL